MTRSKADQESYRGRSNIKENYKLGWQVMYFSAEGRLKSLREDIDCGNINYVELQVY